MSETLQMQFGFDFEELQSPAGLHRLDNHFIAWLSARDISLHAALLAYRGQSSEPRNESDLLIELAEHLEQFVAQLYGIEQDVARHQEQLRTHGSVQQFKKTVVHKAHKIRKAIGAPYLELCAWLRGELQQESITEAAVATLCARWQQQPEQHAEKLQSLLDWCALALRDPEGIALTSGWVSFRLPQAVDAQALVHLEHVPQDPYGRLQANPRLFRARDGFHLTDWRMDLARVENEIHYCVYCHDHDGDFCAKGFPQKKSDPQQGLKRNALGEILTGCPLEEKISEMHLLRSRAHSIAALAMAMLDNPMVPATGHRICNDCMKACIYQKQQPVDIPQTETRILTDVLNLPWGVEIYDLLTRWNPLRAQSYCMQPYNGRHVLIAGMGPAGFTMAHYLTLSGCAVVGIDGLKIEPLPDALLHAPVRDFSTLYEDLDQRIMMGFGGVAEYGITVRWDKNFLKLIYLTLARRKTFQVFGGIRFGGTMEVEDAWSMGFDHICIANGAGYPKVLAVQNGLARGVRQANDFLMALQLTGAAKDSSLANLQVRLPAVVVGSGLTAIDTATEVQAYYIKQVEKIYHRYAQLVGWRGEEALLAPLDEESRVILQEYLAHGAAVVEERRTAAAQKRLPNFLPLIRRWGGVTIVYRRSLHESPAYRRNHEEINKAMEEGIYYLGGMEPIRIELDAYDHVKGVMLQPTISELDSSLQLPARAVFIAAGASSNTIYEREHPGHFNLQERHYQPYVLDEQLTEAVPGAHCKTGDYGPFTSYNEHKRTVSFIGDAHPVYHGSVVKAIASAKKAYPEVLKALQRLVLPAQTPDAYRHFRRQMEHQLRATVVRIQPMPQLIEMWVQAPLAARKFQAGQFFRLQTFESKSEVIHGTRMQIPLQTISGAGVNGEQIRLVLLRMGANARLAERLQPGDSIVLMGPNGQGTPIPRNKTVMVIAGSWGAAVMLDLGRALREAGNRVLYIAAYRNATEVSFKEELEAISDQIIWATATTPLVQAARAQDLSLQQSDVVKLLLGYAAHSPKAGQVDLRQVHEVMVMGSTGLLQALQSAFTQVLKPLFPEHVLVTGTVGSPMQCMLKGVCAQCLQLQRDPMTGLPTHAVFTCAMQDQILQEIDLDNLAARQKQNRLSEYLGAQWVNMLMDDRKGV